MQAITSTLTEVLVNIALAAITLLGAYVLYYIRVGVDKVKAQAAQLKDERARKLLEDALDDVVNVGSFSVNSMEQTTARELREAVKTGKADREELIALGKKVFDVVKASVSPEAQRVITENLGSFDSYLTKCIEDAVLKVKQSDPYLTLSGELFESVEVKPVEAQNTDAGK